jgi:hypothetical protein
MLCASTASACRMKTIARPHRIEPFKEEIIGPPGDEARESACAGTRPTVGPDIRRSRAGAAA